MAEFQITKVEGDDSSVIYLNGNLDIRNVPQVKETVTQLMQQGKRSVVVSFKNLTHVSENGFSDLIGFMKDVRYRGGNIKVADVNPKIYRVFDLLGFPTLFEISDMEEREDFSYQPELIPEGPISSDISVEQISGLSTTQKLTPEYLKTQIIPYLQAIFEFQYVIDEINDRSPHDIRLVSISQNSPVSISLEGATEAIKLIKESVIPWRRKHAEMLAALVESEKLAEIEIRKAEIKEKHARAEKESAEAAKQRAEVERMNIENEKLRLKLYRAKIQLGIEILTQISPTLSETERVSFLIRLLPSLDTLTSSELTLSYDNK